MSIEEAERKAAWSGLFDAIDGTVRRALDRSQGTQARYGRRGHSERLEVSDRDDGEYDYDANGSCGGGGCGEEEGDDDYALDPIARGDAHAASSASECGNQ